jgi:hypothetical protein
MVKSALVCSIVLAVSAGPVLAQANPRGQAKATLAGKSVVIEYGRPSLKGRDMLGQAEVGKAWRMGADSATTLKTEAELTLGTASVPKGTYTLKATKVAEDKWNLNIIAQDEAKTAVADVPLTTSKLPASVELFTLELKGEKEKGEFEMRWGTTSLKAPFTAK